ncbi:hypothetical protein R3P38DRAFT_220871 [Favolaschia claudopus]|uniref:SAM domain-containing protein n=1 Tax=Favolaschia claudopus TaxID=2862362 RepID=A0AAV9ZT18_9AGAR
MRGITNSVNYPTVSGGTGGNGGNSRHRGGNGGHGEAPIIPQEFAQLFFVARSGIDGNAGTVETQNDNPSVGAAPRIPRLLINMEEMDEEMLRGLLLLGTFTIPEFCAQGHLSDTIRQLLEDNVIEPRTLLEVYEDELRGVGFKVGHIAELRRTVKDLIYNATDADATAESVHREEDSITTETHQEKDSITTESFEEEDVTHTESLHEEEGHSTDK